MRGYSETTGVSTGFSYPDLLNWEGDGGSPPLGDVLNFESEPNVFDIAVVFENRYVQQRLIHSLDGPMQTANYPAILDIHLLQEPSLQKETAYF